jgi:DNA-binding MarR family transcriptional regulator
VTDADEPRWLGTDERQAWLALVSVVIRLPSALDAQLRRDAGVSHFEYQVLAMLSEAPERTHRMSELAMLAEGSLSRLSQVVDRLERRGWVKRSPDPTDGRYTLAKLTAAGWRKVVATAPGHVAAVRTLVFDPLSKSQTRQLTDIGRRIIRAIDPSDPCLERDRLLSRNVLHLGCWDSRGAGRCGWACAQPQT